MHVYFRLEMNQNNQNMIESNQLMAPQQPLIEGANGAGSFPPDPMGTAQIRQEEPPFNPNGSLEFSPSISSQFDAILTPTVFNFAPPPADFPLQLKILHILMAHIGSGEYREKLVCRLQSPSAVAKGQLGFVVEHDLAPFNRTNNVFAESRFRDLERRSQASVSEFGSKFIELAPPPPMNTLTLLCLASDRLQMDPQMTIEIARKLSKIGLISSPLTSGDKYSPGFPRKEMVTAMVLHLDELCGVRLNAQEILSNFVRPIHRLGSAEPIHPVLVDHRETKYRKALNDDHLARRLYELICRYFLATCMCPSKVAEMTIKFSVGPEVFKSVKHTMIIQGFLVAAPWMRPEYCDNELPIEATKQQNQFIKQTFIVSDVQRLQLENPKGGLSESKLISQMAFLGLGNYDTIPETLSKLVQYKLVNIVGPGRWIVPTSEGLQKLESFRQNGVETDCDNEKASDSSEDRKEPDESEDVHRHRGKTVPKHVRFSLPPERMDCMMRSKSLGRELYADKADRALIGRNRRAPSPDERHTHFSDSSRFRRSSRWTPSSASHNFEWDIRQQQRSRQFNSIRDHSFRTRPQELHSNQIWMHGVGKENCERTSRYAATRTFGEGVRSGLEEAQVVVDNVSQRTDFNRLIGLFCKFGNIRNADMQMFPRRIFIKFAKLTEAENAISEMDRKTLDGSVLSVEKNQQQTPTKLSRRNSSQSANSPRMFADYAGQNGLRGNQPSSQSEEFIIPSTPINCRPASRSLSFNQRSNAQRFQHHTANGSASSHSFHRHSHNSFLDGPSPSKILRFDEDPFSRHMLFDSPPPGATFPMSSSHNGFHRFPFRGSFPLRFHRQNGFDAVASSQPVRSTPSSQRFTPRHSFPFFPNEKHFFFRR